MGHNGSKNTNKISIRLVCCISLSQTLGEKVSVLVPELGEGVEMLSNCPVKALFI